MTWIYRTPDRKIWNMVAGDGGTDFVITFVGVIASADIDEAELIIKDMNNNLMLQLLWSDDATHWSLAGIAGNDSTVAISADDTATWTGSYMYNIRLTSADVTITSMYGILNVRQEGATADGLTNLATPVDTFLTICAGFISELLTAQTYNSTYTFAVQSATVNWPDGETGTFTGTNLDSAIGGYKGWTATYKTYTVTQPALTFDADGRVTTRPVVTIT